jgi:hypothetical protein
VLEIMDKCEAHNTNIGYAYLCYLSFVHILVHTLYCFSCFIRLWYNSVKIIYMPLFLQKNYLYAFSSPFKFLLICIHMYVHTYFVETLAWANKCLVRKFIHSLLSTNIHILGQPSDTHHDVYLFFLCLQWLKWVI